MENKFRDFLKNNTKYLIVLAVGVALIIISSGGGQVEHLSGKIETQLKQTLQMAEGVGDVEIMVTYNEDGSAQGAIIIAEGAKNSGTKKLLLDCATAVLNLPDYKVQILNKKE